MIGRTIRAVPIPDRTSKNIKSLELATMRLKRYFDDKEKRYGNSRRAQHI